MPRNPTVERASSSLGGLQRFTIAFPAEFFTVMDEISVECGYASRAEAVRNAVLFYRDAMEMAKAGQEIVGLDKSGKQTKLYGAAFALLQRKALGPSLGQ